MSNRSERLRAAGLTETEIQAVLKTMREPTISITVRVPASQAEKIDAKARNRSEYLRNLIERDVNG